MFSPSFTRTRLMTPVHWMILRMGLHGAPHWSTVRGSMWRERVGKDTVVSNRDRVRGMEIKKYAVYQVIQGCIA